MARIKKGLSKKGSEMTNGIFLVTIQVGTPRRGDRSGKNPPRTARRAVSTMRDWRIALLFLRF